MTATVFSFLKSRRGIVLAATGLAVFAALLASRICVAAEEDAFIYYRYALHAVRGEGLVFNPPVPVEGFSSPLWMFLLVGIASFFQKIHVAARVAGLLLGGGAVGATVLLARSAGLPVRAGVASGLCLALNFYFLLWSQSGLETPLYALLVVVGAGWFLRTEERPEAPPTRRHRIVGGALLGMAALGRPEGILLTGVAALWLALRRESRGGLLAYLWGFAPVFGSYLVWRRWYFDAWMPNTSMKLYPLHLDRSVPQALDSVVYLGVVPFVVLLAGWLLSRRDGGRIARSLRFLGIAGLVLSYGFHFLAGGDYRPGFRYLLPGLPLLLVAAFAGLELGLARSGVRQSRAWLAAALLTGSAVVPSLLLWSRQLPPAALPGLISGAHCPEGSLGDPVAWGDAQADWIVRNAPRNAIVAYGQMGKAPYRAAVERPDLRFLDTVGWVDRRVAGLYGLGGKLRGLVLDLRTTGSLAAALELGRQRRAEAFVEILLECQPEIVLVEPHLGHAGVALLARAEEFQRRYRLVAEIGPPPAVRVFGLAPGASPRAVDVTACF